MITDKTRQGAVARSSSSQSIDRLHLPGLQVLEALAPPVPALGHVLLPLQGLPAPADQSFVRACVRANARVFFSPIDPNQPTDSSQPTNLCPGGRSPICCCCCTNSGVRPPPNRALGMLPTGVDAAVAAKLSAAAAAGMLSIETAVCRRCCEEEDGTSPASATVEEGEEEEEGMAGTRPCPTRGLAAGFTALGSDKKTNGAGRRPPADDAADEACCVSDGVSGESTVTERA